MKCIAVLCTDSAVIMERIHGVLTLIFRFKFYNFNQLFDKLACNSFVIQTLLKSLQVESKTLLTTLTSLAQIATFSPGVFEKNSLEIVREFIVKKIITVDDVCYLTF